MEMYYDVVTDTSGNIINGATVTVYYAAGGAASIYDKDGSPQANPFLSGLNRSEGEVEFAAANGLYDIKVVNGAETDWKYDVSLFDASDIELVIHDTVAAMKADTGLLVNQVVKTRGYYAVDDGGSAEYIIKSSQSVDGYGDHTLTNGNVALINLNENILLKRFGAKGDGITNDTSAIQAALNNSATNKRAVIGNGSDTYLVSTLLIKNGTVAFDTMGGIILPNGSTNPNNLTTEAAVVMQGALTGGVSVENCRVSLTIDMQNGDRTALLCDTPINCTFTKNKIYGFTNHATYNHRGIRLQEAPIGNKVYDNEIEGYDTPTQRGLLIDVWCSLTGAVNFGGFFTGTLSRQPTPAENNIISGNTLINGSYALNLQGGEYNIFSNNVCVGQNHRCVWAGNGSWYNTFVGNEFVNFSSTAMLCAYGFCHNLISSNNCHNDGAIGVGGEAAINVYTGSMYNLIIGNEIDAPVNYSVYIATDSSHNVIDGNHSKNAYVAAFAVENDWISARPTNDFYTKPNYEDPTTLDPPYSTSWTYNDLENTVFQNNTVHYGYTGRNIAAFSVAHIQNGLSGATPTKLKGVTLKNNTVLTSTNIGYGLYVYEHVAGQLEDITLIGNTWPISMTASTTDFRGATSSAADVDMRTIGLIYAKNNGYQLDALITGTALVFTDADTTPDVSNWIFFSCNNSGATSITDFDGAQEGKEIIIRGDTNTTIVYTSALIRPKGLVDVTGMTTNSLISFKSISGVWIEMYRNF